MPIRCLPSDGMEELLIDVCINHLQVPVGLVYAKATAIVWPPSRIQKLETRGFHDDRYYVKQNPNVTLFQDP